MTHQSQPPDIQSHSRTRPRRGQTMVEFALTLPILLLLMFGIIEFGRIFQAWVTIQNAARVAVRYAVTGQYDANLFNIDHAWSTDLSTNPGVPCPYTATDPLQATFKAHWNQMACNPGNDDNLWMRRDMLRMYTIYQEARIGAAGLALNPNGPDIPGIGFGSQTRAELLTKLATERGWFHVWICSTRVTLQDTDGSGKPYARYTQGDQGADAVTNGVKFGQCQVNEKNYVNGAGTLTTDNSNPAYVAHQDQYDPGAPGDLVQVIVYFNHPLITPLGLNSAGFITLQARRVAVNESFRTSKVINLSDSGSGAASINPPNLQKSFAPNGITLSQQSVMTLSITNPNSGQALSGIGFTDTFPNTLTNLGLVPGENKCGGTVTPGAVQTISASGITVAAGGSCTIKYNVKPTTGVATANSQISNTTSAIVSTEGGSNGPATGILSIVGAPGITLSTYNPQLVQVNGSSDIVITINNPNSTLPLTGLSFTDFLCLPANSSCAGVKLSSAPSTSDTTCLTSSGGAKATPSYTTGANKVQLIGFQLDAGASCTLTLHVKPTAVGSYVNSTTGVFSNEAGTGVKDPVDQTLQAVQALVGTKMFGTAPGQPTLGSGSTTSLTITLDNHNNATTDATGVNFTDTLPGGLTTQGSAAWGTGGCTVGTFNTTSTSVSLANGTVPAGAICTITVTVLGNGSSSVTNTVSNLTSNLGNSGPFSASISLLSAPTGTKSFQQTAVAPSTTTMMTITVTNPNTGSSLTGVTFTDTFPTLNAPNGLQTSGATSASPSGCTGSLSAPGSNSLVLSNGTIPANTTCSYKVLVQAATAGIYTNTVNVSTSTGSTGNLTATLMVVAAPTITLGFSQSTTPANALTYAGSNDAIGTGQNSYLTFVIVNPLSNTNINLTGIDFKNLLPTGLTYVSGTPAVNDCGLTVNQLGSGNQTAYFSSTTLSKPPNSACTLTVQVKANTTSGSPFSENIPAVNTSQPEYFSYTVTNANAPFQTYTPATGPASNTATLTVSSGLTITKTFVTNPMPHGTTSQLKIVITNPLAQDATGVTFTDTLPTKVTTSGSSTLTGCTAGTASSTSSTVTLTNGTVPKNGGTCTITINVTGTVLGDYTNTIGANTITSSLGTNALQAQDILHIIDGPTITKAVSTQSIQVNSTATTLTITITNPNKGVDLTNFTFTDPFPTNGGTGQMIVFTTPNVKLTSNTSKTSDCGLTINGYKNGASTGAAPVAGDTGIVVTGTITHTSKPTQCTIKIDVTATAVGDYTNVISNATSDLGPQQAPATAPVVHVNSNPATVAKVFGTPVIPIGGTSLLTITITNPNTTSPAGDLTNMTVTDPLPTNGGTGQMTIVAPPAATTDCGGTVTAANGTSSVTLTGGSLTVAKKTCTIVVTVTGATAGVYTNTTSGVAANTPSGATGTGPASPPMDLIIVGPPQIGKAFSPTTVPAGTPSTLTLTITNNNTKTDLTGVNFVDNLPPGLTTTGGNAVWATGTCTGTLTTTSTSVTLAGGTIPMGTNCTITVNVQGPYSATKYSNTTGVIGSGNGGQGNTANALLTIQAVSPVATKAFGTSPIQRGATSTVTITIKNPNATQSLSGVVFNDPLPTNVTFAATPNISVSPANCTKTPTISGTTIGFTGGTIAANTSCTIKFDVTSSTGGSYTNTLAAVTSTEAAASNTPSDTLIVLSPPSIIKDYAGSTNAFMTSGDTITLNITLGNGNPSTVSVAQSGVAFSDSLPTGLKIAGAATSSCGGTLTAVLNSSTISLTGGAIASGSTKTCVISVPVTSTTLGLTTNTTGTVSSTNGGTGLTATAKLTVQAPTVQSFSKAFSPSNITDGATSKLTITINNPNPTPLTGVSASDTLPSSPNNGLKFATPANAASTCGVTPTVSGTTISISGGTIAKNASCTITVNVINVSSVSSAASYYDYVNTIPSVSSTEAGTNNTAATATLRVNTSVTLNALGFSKSFVKATPIIGQPANVTYTNTVITLNFTITNSNVVPVAGLSFTDTFPSSTIKVTSAGQTNTCGGTLTAASGTSSVSLSGGSLGANATCNIQVTVSGSAAGTYTNDAGKVSTTTANVPAGTNATAQVIIVAGNNGCTPEIPCN